jgi:hypothetical protein
MCAPEQRRERGRISKKEDRKGTSERKERRGASFCDKIREEERRA